MTLLGTGPTDRLRLRIGQGYAVRASGVLTRTGHA